MKKPFKTSSLKPTSQALAANHHDIFFKSFFSDPGLTLDIFKLVFSKQELSSLNLKQLKNEKDSFSDKRADLVFSVPLKNQPKVQLKILFLLEHKSHYDAQLFSQLLYYQSVYEEFGREWQFVGGVGTRGTGEGLFKQRRGYEH